MFYYKAPNPYASSFSNFLSSIFKPMFSSPSIGKIVLQAQGQKKSKISEANLENFARRFKLTIIDTGTVETYDGAKLETVEIKPSKESQRFIIKFNGNGAKFSDYMENFLIDAEDLNSTIIGFNYRGVNYSTLNPKTYNELLIDGIAQVQRLLDKGVPSRQILLDGHSLGGSIATMVAKHFHDKGLPVYLWNDRSFSSLARAAAGVLCPADSSLEDIGASSSYSTLAAFNWNVNVARAYNSIPAEYKRYMYVSKKAAAGKGDGVISHNASLHRAVKSNEIKAQELTGFKVTTRDKNGGHNLPRWMLFSKSNPEINGQQIFESFVNSHMKN